MKSKFRIVTKCSGFECPESKYCKRTKLKDSEVQGEFKKAPRNTKTGVCDYFVKG